jgi:hypothetical protein
MNRGNRVSDLFPWPLVGVALLVALMILLTPVLIAASGPPAAGSVSSYAELIIDALPGNNSTHFYVHGLGTTTRYSHINLGFADGFLWTGAFPKGPLNWSDWQNFSSVLAVISEVNQNPVAVNVTALYSVNGASALFVGVFAVFVGTPPGSSTDTLSVVSDTPGIGGFSYPVASLPVAITLSDIGGGGGS